MPALPPEARTLNGWALIRKCLWGMVPSIVLIFLVLGTILMGLATPTEGGAMGAVGAIVLAVLHSDQFSMRGKYAALIALGAMVLLTALTMLGAIAAGLLSMLEKPLFIVLYTGLVVVLLEAVFIAKLRGLIWEASQSTMRISTMVIFILVGSTVFGLVFRGVDGDLAANGR